MCIGRTSSVCSRTSSDHPRTQVPRRSRPQRVENTQSKATLALAIKKLVALSEANLYFPSYEILMDELRDYRFYAKDMVHPSELAQEYIQNKFKNCFYKKSCHQDIQELEIIKKRRQHRHRRPEADQARAFDLETKNRMNVVLKKYPKLSFKDKLAT